MNENTERLAQGPAQSKRSSQVQALNTLLASLS